MNRTLVRSSNLVSIGYDSNKNILEVEFNSGSIYQYYRVPESKYLNLMNAYSHGKYFTSKIRNVYRPKQIR